ncbi:MAG: hypothetical protein AAF533_30840 [Acidobacteriota bacterium]
MNPTKIASRIITSTGVVWTLSRLGALLLAVTLGLSGPVRAQVSSTCEDFEDGLGEWGPCVDWPNIDVSLDTPGPSGDPDDQFVRTVDFPNESSLCAASEYLGDWSEVAATGCGRFCWDFQLIVDNSGRPDQPATLVFRSDDGPGGDPTTEAVFTSSLRFTVDSGWHRVCAPVRPLRDGALPGSSEGTWTMRVGDPEDWNDLLADVTLIRFGTDYPDLFESQGFDNVCIEQVSGCLSHDFDGLPAGTEVTTQFAGLIVSGTAPVVSFDTSTPSCGDDDLATPGVGPGNDLPLGDVLILSEEEGCLPDDARDGGTFVFEYEQPSDVSWIGLLDVEEEGGEIRLFDVQGVLIDSVVIPGQAADNGWQRVDLNASCVTFLEVELVGSGAVTDLACASAMVRRGRLEGPRISHPDRDASRASEPPRHRGRVSGPERPELSRRLANWN